MSDAIHEETYKGYLIEIHLDDEPFDPRKDFDHLGTMACWHRRYVLGDVQPKQDPKEYIIDLLDEVLPTSFYVPARFDGSLQDYLGEWEEQKFNALFSKYFVHLSVFMYEHSGISISTGRNYPFNCPWDSGQLGFIYVSKQKFMKEWGKKKWSNDLQQKAIKLLQGEVQEYDDYLTGNVYGYCIWSLDNEEEKLEQIDSCWGYFPDHQASDLHGSSYRPDYQYCLDEAKSYVDWKVKEDEKEQALLQARMMNEKVDEK